MDHASEILEVLTTLDYVKVSVPIFSLLIIVEAYAARKKGFYRINDAFNSLSCGIIRQLFTGASKLVFLMPYAWVHSHFGLFDFTSLSFWPKLFSWFSLLVMLDFFYYWYHRSAHRVNIGWATHVVHHSSEEYNLTTALRQGAFQDAFSFSFFLPLALIGFPTSWYFSMYSLNLVYQFFIHTRTVNKTPAWCEAIFNTPSHHRVHHGQNSQYIDKNHGGMFIIWDRLFGTFEPEVEEPVYGITTPLASWNPIWAQLHFFSTLINETRLASSWSDKIKVWIKDPGWRPKGLPPYEAKPVSVATFTKFNPLMRKKSLHKAIIFFTLGMVLSHIHTHFTEPFSVLYSVAIIVTLFVLIKVGRSCEEKSDEEELKGTYAVK